MTDSLQVTSLFTGGVALIRLASGSPPSSWALTRSYGATTTEIPVVASTGEGFSVFVDDGYGLEGPLPAGQTIEYKFTTDAGSTTASVILAANLYLTSESLLGTITRALTATAKTVVLPDSTAFSGRATVRQAMPLTQSPPLPLISVEEVAQHQSLRSIGADVNADVSRNQWVISEQADLRYHIGVFTRTIPERQFWKSAVLATMKALSAQIGPVLGQDNTVSYQISQGQISPTDLPPGFYFAEIGFNISGPTSIVVKTDYDVIQSVETTANGTDSTLVPISL